MGKNLIVTQMSTPALTTTIVATETVPIAIPILVGALTLVEAGPDSSCMATSSRLQSRYCSSSHFGHQDCTEVGRTTKKKRRRRRRRWRWRGNKARIVC